MFSIRQLLQQLSIDLASTRLQHANTFVQQDQDLVKWVFAVLLKLCKVDEYASTRLVGDIEGRPENLDDKTSPRVRSGSSPDNSSTEGLTSPSAPYFSEDQNTDPLPRLQSQADVENCKNQLIERISQSDSVITK
ncbi:unnamed protein product [Dibothriocephalus latus]|uniref:Uncharacterized protein n=1 Tax=Dibothriocephalus latus TaxID=60516 RepID=A0A3P6PZE8_DIBLA|nr:unnamed protein product [Dibothriocephalus latus]